MVLALVAAQSIDLSDGASLLTATGLWLLKPVSLIGLFALTGFGLARRVDQSGLRCGYERTGWEFLPALAIAVVLTAFIFGALVTKRRLGSYYFDTETWRYLLGAVAFPQYSLPGVFDTNNVASVVNANLGYVPIGIAACVVLLVAFLAAGRSSVVLLATVGAAIAAGLFFQYPLSLFPFQRTLASLWVGDTMNVTVAFFLGAIAYRERSRLVIDRRAGGLVLAALAIAWIVGSPRMLEDAMVGTLVTIAVCYLALLACSLPWPFRHSVKPLEPLLWRIVLLSYPVQQVWMSAGPSRQSATLNLILSGPTIIFLAAIQWFLIERPLLRRFGRSLAGWNEWNDVQLAGDLGGRRSRTPLDHMRSLLPSLIAAAVIVAITLVAIKLAMFALQKDSAG
ncbi:hypothetical protein EON83_24730 [bacterium]|nr:MAG: hypothetical protein EON83_24730 [bacterium]